MLGPIGNVTYQRNLQLIKGVIDHGEGLHKTWTNLTYEEPPDDLFGRILWTGGVLGQLFVSLATFPAALGAFLLEEAVQTYGMGAYMLATADAWETLNEYVKGYKQFIAAQNVAAKTLATVNPTTGGAVLIYMEAAKIGADAFAEVAKIQYNKQVKYDEEARKKELERMKYGEIRIESRPSLAEIWIDEKNTEKLTPETLEELEPGTHTLTLRRYNTQTESWDIYSTLIGISKGKRKEILVPIPEGVMGEEETDEETQEKEEQKLPEFLTAEVTGDIAKDGDTFITINDEYIRLIGIDTPESGRPFYEEAKEYLQNEIEDKALDLKIQTDRPFDQYGRTLAEVRNYKGNINVAMLAKGYARQDWFEEDTLNRTRYEAAEQLAKKRGLGIWKEKYG